MMQSRTHNCNQLRIENVGEKVKLVGWMENVREVGGNLAFVVLRDFYGTTQVVVEDEADLKVIKGINKESTISVEGTVRERASKNSKQATGEIEVVPEKIEVLGRCRYNSLPFEINRSREADETQRLKYRYLDLRNPAVKKNIILRCQVIAALRQAMMAHDFLEITTPILTASSPEGARDYLVPARKHPGKFYALPQAPQQFKQLLMTSGFDRYFQIAPCFRDEDARGDRSPGEFYQLDMEMSFATQEDVFAICEDVLPPIFAKFGTYDIASQPPFRRIAYNDALAVYGSDKPDLRIDLTATDVTELFAENEFEALRGQTVKAVPITDCKLTRKQIDKLLGDCEVQSGTKSYWFKVDENGDLAGGIALGGTRLLDGRISLDDLIRHMLKHGSQIGLKALQLANATLALQGTRSLAGIESHAHQAATAHAGAIGRHIGHTVNDWCRQRGSQVIDHVIAAEQGLDNRAIPGTHGQTVDQTRTGSALGSSRAAHAATHQQRLARGLLLVQSRTTGALKRSGVIKQQGIDIASKQLLDQALELTRSLEHVA